MERLHIAYSLMALMAIAAGIGGAYWRRNSPARTYRRRLLRERAAHAARMMARTDRSDPVPQAEKIS